MAASSPRIAVPPIDEKAPNALFLQYVVGEIGYLHSCVDETKGMVAEVLAWQKAADETVIAENAREKEKDRIAAVEKAIADRRLSYLRQTWNVVTKVTNNGVLIAGIIALVTVLYNMLGK